ncbi:MAG: calcium-binding protein [Defluviicoccus sp.]
MGTNITYGFDDTFNNKANEKQAVIDALTAISNAADVEFIPTDDATSASYKFSLGCVSVGDPHKCDGGGTYDNIYYDLNKKWYTKAHITINNQLTIENNQFEWVVLHEVVELLTGRNKQPSSSYPDITLDNSVRIDFDKNVLFYPSTPMLIDIRWSIDDPELHKNHGANWGYNTGNNKYPFSELTKDSDTTQFYKTIWDAGGSDTIDFSFATLPATIDLNNGAFSWIGEFNRTDGKYRVAIAEEGRDEKGNVKEEYKGKPLNAIESATGGNGDDKITGNDFPNTLRGGPGNDALSGLKGYDNLFGESGNDSLNGNEGTDKLYGGADNDSLYGGADNDDLDGGAGTDSLSGEAGADKLYGGADNDSLYGGADNDSLSGEGGNDYLYGELGDDSLDGGDGLDKLYGGDGLDTIDGGAGNDEALGGAGDDLIEMGDGNDLARGEAGNDTLDGGLGSDTLYGGADNDLISGGDGNDAALGGDGNDSINMGEGNDWARGEAGNDALDGGLGSDTLYGGGGDDTLIGQPKDDRLIGSYRDSRDFHPDGIDIFKIVADDVEPYETGQNNTILYGFGHRVDNRGDYGNGDKIDLRGLDAHRTGDWKLVPSWWTQLPPGTIQVATHTWKVDGYATSLLAGKDSDGTYFQMFIDDGSANGSDYTVEDFIGVSDYSALL